MDTSQITEAAVRDALDASSRARTLADSPLLELNALREHLADEGMAESAESLAWALSDLLAEVVWAALGRLRSQPAADPPAQLTVDLELADVARDFASGHTELEAWSCVYHRYLAPHSLQVREMAAVARPGAPHGRKHITRRTNLGLSLLAAELRGLELAVAGRSSTTARSASGAAAGPEPPHNLPRRRSSFVGRERELEDLHHQLDQAALLTLAGPGGVGKTRLALQLAAQRLDRYPDGVFLVELASLSQPDLVVQAIAADVGVSEGHGPDLARQVVAHLSGRTALLLLDNCEHLVSACAFAADMLLKACPELRILATSREPLGVEGEVVAQVPPLNVPDESSIADARALTESAALQLFVDRARAVRPGFDPAAGDGSELAEIAELCRELDGLPLAIELAAARVRHMPVDEILLRLGDRFKLLTRGRRTDQTRHQTLREAIDWSYDLLSEQERSVFECLAVFRGGWTMPAAEAMSAAAEVEPDDAMDLVAQLADKSLIAATADPPEARYDMLRSVRDYAEERLADGGSMAAAQEAHLGWFCRLADEAAVEMDGPSQSEWLDVLSREHANVLAALGSGGSTKDARCTALAMAGAMARFWLLRGHLTEGRTHLEQVLADPLCDEPTATRATALDGAGALAFNQGDYVSARGLHEESLAIRQELGDERGVAEALRHLGNVADETADYARAEELYERALGMWRDLGDAWGEAATLNNLGLVALRQGAYVAASAYLEESLRLFREQEAAWAVGVTLANLADISFDLGDTDAARGRYEESFAIATELEDRDGIAYALTGLANVARRDEDWGTAWTHLDQSLAMLQELGDRQGIVEWLESCAKLVYAEGRAICAARLLGASEELREEIDAPLSPKDLPSHERLVAALLDALGDDGLATARREAGALGWQAVVADAQDGGPDSISPSGATDR